jgi:ABC-2 type transport system ATP-binding protein
VAEEMAAAHPLLRYRVQGGNAALFDGEPPAPVQALGRRMRPSLVDLFVALTRKPEATARSSDPPPRTPHEPRCFP